MAANNIPLAVANLDVPLVSQIDVAAEVGKMIVAPPIVKDKCRIKAGKRVDHYKTKPGESSLARDIRDLCKQIRSATDCQHLQDELKKALDSMGIHLDVLKDTVQKKLEELFPLLKVPLNPFKLPKYIVKQTIGRIMPDVEALIDQVKRIIEVMQALMELIQVAQTIEPKLRQCAISTLDQLEAAAKNVVQEEIRKVEKMITDSIADAICETANASGITLNDIDTIFSAINTVGEFISTAKQLQSTAQSAVEGVMGVVGTHQTTVQELTGIAPVLDTTSTDAFLASVNSPEYAQWNAEVGALALLPEPVISVSPVVTGNAVVGETLLVSNGTWTANGVVTDFTYAWQWYREGQPIDGANTFSYSPVMADVEHQVYCMVSAENHTNIEQVESNKTAAVVVASNSSTIPVISGTPTSGQPLQSSDGSWPFTPSTIMYEWWREITPGSNVRVQSLSGNNIYTCKSADIGLPIFCRVVASSFKYTVAQTSASTTAVS